MSLAHPNAYLNQFTIENCGNGQGRIQGEMAGVLTKRSSKRVRLLDLDSDLFELRDQEGFWLAKRRLTPWQPGVRRHPDLLEFHWQHCGALDFRGDVERLGKRAALQAELELEVPIVRITLQPTGGKEYSIRHSIDRPIRWLVPGEYDITLHHPSLVTQRQHVVIEAGRVTPLMLRVRRAPGLRKVNIEVHAGTGPWPWFSTGRREEFGVTVLAFQQSEPMGMWMAEFESILGCGAGREAIQPIRWEKHGEENVGSATLCDIPPGTLELSIRTHPDAYYSVETHLPNGDISLAITLLRDMQGPGWGFKEVLQGDSSGPSDGWLDQRTIYELTEDHRSIALFEYEGHSLVVPDRMARPPSRWACSAMGQKPVYGTAADFLADGSDLRLAAIEFTPGFETEIWVVDEKDRPVSKASILADGKPVATTDANGIAMVHLVKAPRLLSAQIANLRWDLDSWDLFSSPAPWYQARLVAQTDGPADSKKSTGRRGD